MSKLMEQPIDKIIAEDSSGAQLMKLTNEFQSSVGTVKRALNKGLPMKEAEASRVIVASLTAATEVVEKIWAEHHELNFRRN